MKKIEQSISEVANYFKTKVVAGDYEFVSCDENKATVRIDGKYEFFLWIGNGENNFNFFNLDLFSDSFKIEEGKKEGWDYLMPLVKDYRKNVLLKEKIAELKKLQKEFGI